MIGNIVAGFMLYLIVGMFAACIYCMINDPDIDLNSTAAVLFLYPIILILCAIKGFKNFWREL